MKQCLVATWDCEQLVWPARPSRKRPVGVEGRDVPSLVRPTSTSAILLRAGKLPRPQRKPGSGSGHMTLAHASHAGHMILAIKWRPEVGLGTRLGRPRGGPGGVGQGHVCPQNGRRGCSLLCILPILAKSRHISRNTSHRLFLCF